MAKKSLVLVIIVAAILAACGAPATPEPTATVTVAPTNTAAPTATVTAAPTATVTAAPTATVTVAPEPEFACGITASELAEYNPGGSFSEGHFAGEAGHSYNVEVVFTDRFANLEIRGSNGFVMADIDAMCAVTLDGEGNRKIVLVAVQAQIWERPGVNVLWAFTYSALLGFPVDMTPYMGHPDRNLHQPEEISRAVAGRFMSIMFPLDASVADSGDWGFLLTELFGGNPDYQGEIKNVVETKGVSIDNNDPPLLWLYGSSLIK